MFNSYHSARDISHCCLKQQWWYWWIFYDEVSVCNVLSSFFQITNSRPCETPKFITVCLSVRHEKWALFKKVPPYPPKLHFVTVSPHFPVFHHGSLPTIFSSTGSGHPKCNRLNCILAPRSRLRDIGWFWVSDYDDDDSSDILCWIPSILAVTFHNAIIISLTWMHNSHLQQPEVRLP